MSARPEAVLPSPLAVGRQRGAHGDGVVNPWTVHGPFWPGIRLMRSLRFSGKLMLVAVALLVSLAYLGGIALHGANVEIDGARLEQRGLEQIQRIQGFVDQVRAHRDQVAIPGADPKAGAPAVAAVDSAWQALAALPDAHWAALGALKARQELGEAWTKRQPSLSRSGEEQGLADSLLIYKALLLIQAVGDGSGASTDAAVDVLQLSQSGLLQQPRVIEGLAQIRLAAAQILSDPSSSADDVRDLAALHAQTFFDFNGSRSALARVVEVHPDLGPAVAPDARLALVFNYFKAVRQGVLRNKPEGDPRQVLADGAAAIEAAVAMQRVAADELGRIQQARITSAQWHRAQVLAIALGCTGFALYMAVAFYRSLTGGLERLKDEVNRMASGDLSSRPQPWGRDEIADALTSMRGSLSGLAKLFDAVREETALITEASRDLADNNSHLAERTTATGELLLEVEQSVGNIQGSFAQSAQRIGDAARHAHGLREQSGQSQQAMLELRERIDGLQQKSAQIGEIIGLIDAIAFQTNILALNASVEAARAGDRGRGFAVVAQEVRELARRSARSAQDIKGIVNASTEDISAGVVLAQRATAAVGQTQASVGTVAGVLDELTQFAQEGRAGVDAVVRVMEEISAATRENAQLTQNFAVSTEAMRERGAVLDAEVMRIKLG